MPKRETNTYFCLKDNDFKAAQENKKTREIQDFTGRSLDTMDVHNVHSVALRQDTTLHFISCF